MLERHLQGTPAKIGVGANRAAIASIYFQRYGYIDPRGSLNHETLSSENISCGDKIGVAILDDGMQAASSFMAKHRDRYGECNDPLGKPSLTSSRNIKRTIFSP
ncbi:unnamed protein product [Cuscuta epithymum]|uniref:Uncharacterized protein n=1 Tax=Cuscuta epithymum TaxID=186058 RepID=A0AAV0FTW1_9ASTE|nr:unnamed protein product [Cuscuta epithymum]